MCYNENRMYAKHVAHFVKSYNISWVIKVLIVSDFVIWSANQLFAPVFAIFVENNLTGGTIAAIGIASGIYLITKSVFVVPVGRYIDKKRGETDDLYSAVIGTAITGVVLLLYTQIDSIVDLYLLQILLGIGGAIAYPGWFSIFTRHVDKDKQGFEWSLYDVALSGGMAAAAAIGGYLADSLGFNTLFVVASAATLMGSLLLLTLRSEMRKK